VVTTEAPAAVRQQGPVELPGSIAVKDLATALSVSHAEIIKELIRNGIFATINQTIDFDTASLVAAELGFEAVDTFGLGLRPGPKVGLPRFGGHS